MNYKTENIHMQHNNAALKGANAMKKLFLNRKGETNKYEQNRNNYIKKP